MKTLSKDFTRGNIMRQLILFSLPFMASNAMQVLYSTIDMIIVGHFVGTAGLSAALTVLFMLLYVLLGKQLFMLFSDDPLVHEMSVTFIKAILWMFPAFAVMRGTGAFIQGIGNAKLGMVLAILDGVALRIGLSYLFGVVLELGFFGFVLGYGLAPYGYAIPSLIYFLSGIWKRRRALADRM